jgi:hypothetical protein
MKLFLTFFMASFSQISIWCHVPPENQKFRELELLSLSQIKIPSGHNLEPSGIISFRNEIYLISDELTDKYLYQIRFNRTKWQLTDSITLDLNEVLDLEAIDYCNEIIYFLSESSSRLLKTNGSGTTEYIVIDFSEEDPSTWGNAGWEGLAADCENNILYLVKERQPRKIFRVNLSTRQVEDKFNIPENESNDFSDAKFENGFLYLIERNGNFITKVNPKSHEVIEKVSYRETCSHVQGKLFEPYAYGMAEGLLLTLNEIWLTLDNNHLNVSDYALKQYGMNGNSPVILKFKRPNGF